HFVFLAPSTSDVYTLSLHDALPISAIGRAVVCGWYGDRRDCRLGVSRWCFPERAIHAVVRGADEKDNRHGRHDGHPVGDHGNDRDRKSTRLNSSHVKISYAVFCLKK